jgi:hypothetical protein
MGTMEADDKLVAYCGLYCGECRRFLRGSCPGCHKNHKAKWCGVRKCCIEAEKSSCAECENFSDPNDCKKFNNFMAKMFGLLFRSDRRACIMQIKENGLTEYAREMASKKQMTIKR